MSSAVLEKEEVVKPFALNFVEEQAATQIPPGIKTFCTTSHTTVETTGNQVDSHSDED